jgi:hypothetical protein
MVSWQDFLVLAAEALPFLAWKGWPPTLNQLATELGCFCQGCCLALMYAAAASIPCAS